ncbi:MAG: hypothetical protein LVS60_07990 [Nodosilinea sp. LVE1205-7]|jgi:hypothetical protein
MASTIDDIDLQARQGSIAAIIQVLNEHFAHTGIRTRAVQDSGVLQLLVEAPRPDQLIRESVVAEVRRVLEAISPKGISRVNINSRIVQEQQLLWLEEIKRDPEHSLLWFEPVTLRRPNPLQRLWRDLQTPRQRSLFVDDRSKRSPSSRLAFYRGLIGGVSLALLLLLVGWTTKDWLQNTFKVNNLPPNQDKSIAGGGDSPVASSPSLAIKGDPFVLAVRLAQDCVKDGASATTAAEWLELAVRWQRAADLMALVPASDDRYSVAQDRMGIYARNKQLALKEAERR